MDMDVATPYEETTQRCEPVTEYVPAVMEVCGLWGCPLSRTHAGVSIKEPANAGLTHECLRSGRDPAY